MEDMDEVAGDGFGATMQVSRNNGDDVNDADMSFPLNGGSSRRRSVRVF